MIFLHKPFTCISLSIGTNGKPLAAIGKFSNTIGKVMIGKTLATNGEEITNPMIGNDMYWQFIGNHWKNGYVKHWIRLVMIHKTLIQQIRTFSC